LREPAHRGDQSAGPHGIRHCLDCRKHHGALFYAAAIFAEGAMTITGPTAAYEGRHFSPKCGSSVFARSDGAVELYRDALDAPDRFVPDHGFGSHGASTGCLPFRARSVTLEATRTATHRDA